MKTKHKQQKFLYLGRDTHTWDKRARPMYILSTVPLNWNEEEGQWETQGKTPYLAIFSPSTWRQLGGRYLKPGEQRKIARPFQ
jgi:hypothetical protein